MIGSVAYALGAVMYFAKCILTTESVLEVKKHFRAKTDRRKGRNNARVFPFDHILLEYYELGNTDKVNATIT